MVVVGLDKPSLVCLFGFQATSPSLQCLAQILASKEQKEENTHTKSSNAFTTVQLETFIHSVHTTVYRDGSTTKPKLVVIILNWTFLHRKVVFFVCTKININPFCYIQLLQHISCSSVSGP